MNTDKLYRALHYLMNRFRQMNVLDVGIFKTCLISLGTLIGIYFSKPLRKLAPLLWIVFLFSYVAVFYRLLVAPALNQEN